MHALLTLGLVPLLAASVGWNGNISKIKCNHPIPEFTGDAGVRISRSQARLLCTCIWDKVEVGGWERDALRQVPSCGRRFRFSNAIAAVMALRCFSFQVSGFSRLICGSC